jgi:hypothetical protein
MPYLTITEPGKIQIKIETLPNTSLLFLLISYSKYRASHKAGNVIGQLG